MPTTLNETSRFADQLERYHAAMTLLTGSRDKSAPSPSNRVTVYVVRNEQAVRKLAGDGNKYLGGFYMPRAGGSLAIVPRVDAASGEANMSMIVLLHEYAHHFMTAAAGFPMPRWYSEGAAEFVAAASFDANGGVMLGRPANHRAAELHLARDVKAEELLDPDAYEKRKTGSYDAFYGKSWLLYHYLVAGKRREGQLARYLMALVGGKSSREAALSAFGDLAALERELDAYMRQPRMMALRISADELAVGPIQVRRLREGEAAMMPVRIRSRRGVNEEQAKAILVDARAVATRYPKDPAVLAALAEAEYDAGNDKEAIGAADAALSADPSEVNAYVQKGYALFRQAPDAEDQAAAYKLARAPFVALNRRENDHPLSLVYYYRSFIEQGIDPPPVALDGLERAAELAPFDLGLRMTLAMQQLKGGKRGPARHNLTPIAYNPHGGGMAAAAKRILARIDADPAWNGVEGIGDLMAGSEERDEPASKN